MVCTGLDRFHPPAAGTLRLHLRCNRAMPPDSAAVCCLRSTLDASLELTLTLAPCRAVRDSIGLHSLHHARLPPGEHPSLAAFQRGIFAPSTAQQCVHAVSWRCKADPCRGIAVNTLSLPILEPQATGSSLI